MQRFIIIVAAVASCVSAQASSPTPIGAVIPVGQQCTPGGTPCALGASCYSTNSGLITVCGNFQAQCTSDQQCAYNTCNQGFCNGFLPSPSLSPSASATSTIPSSAPSVAPSSLPLGAQCDATKTPSQCAGGAQCWASNAGLIPACGNFNAQCTTDAQCAFNTCNNNLCSGFKPSSTSGVASPTTGPAYNATRSASATYPAYTGAASVSRVSEMGGLLALFVAAFAGL